MALTKTVQNDKIEVVGTYKFVNVRKASIIKEDGVEITRSFKRHALQPGHLKGGDGSDKNDWVDTDISKEDADVQAICNASWTTDLKNAYKAKLIADQPS